MSGAILMGGNNMIIIPFFVLLIGASCIIEPLFEHFNI